MVVQQLIPQQLIQSMQLRPASPRKQTCPWQRKQQVAFWQSPMLFQQLLWAVMQ